MKTRYSYGGDEHIFVECDEEMSLEAFFKSLSICSGVKKAKIKGVTEICPANDGDARTLSIARSTSKQTCGPRLMTRR